MLDGVRDAVFEPLIEADERQKAEEKMMIARKDGCSRHKGLLMVSLHARIFPRFINPFLVIKVMVAGRRRRDSSTYKRTKTILLDSQGDGVKEFEKKVLLLSS